MEQVGVFARVYIVIVYVREIKIWNIGKNEHKNKMTYEYQKKCDGDDERNISF
jgi:hypothetical protein